MNRRARLIVILIVCCLRTAHAFQNPQYTLSCQNRPVLIGTPVTLTITLLAKPNTGTINWQKVDAILLNITNIKLLKVTTGQTGATTQHQIIFTSATAGRLQIPPLTLLNGVDTLYKGHTLLINFKPEALIANVTPVKPVLGYHLFVFKPTMFSLGAILFIALVIGVLNIYAKNKQSTDFSQAKIYNELWQYTQLLESNIKGPPSNIDEISGRISQLMEMYIDNTRQVAGHVSKPADVSSINNYSQKIRFGVYNEQLLSEYTATLKRFLKSGETGTTSN